MRCADSPSYEQIPYTTPRLAGPLLPPAATSRRHRCRSTALWLVVLDLFAKPLDHHTEATTDSLAGSSGKLLGVTLPLLPILGRVLVVVVLGVLLALPLATLGHGCQAGLLAVCLHDTAEGRFPLGLDKTVKSHRCASVGDLKVSAETHVTSPSTYRTMRSRLNLETQLGLGELLETRTLGLGTFAKLLALLGIAEKGVGVAEEQRLNGLASAQSGD